MLSCILSLFQGMDFAKLQSRLTDLKSNGTQNLELLVEAVCEILAD
jgi:hypothetical protein